MLNDTRAEEARTGSRSNPGHQAVGHQLGIQDLYRDLAEDPTWLESYYRNPGATLERYGIEGSQRPMVTGTIALFARRQRE